MACEVSLETTLPEVAQQSSRGWGTVGRKAGGELGTNNEQKWPDAGSHLIPT